LQIIENKKTINIIISTFILYGKTYCETKKTIQYVKDRTECFDDYYFPYSQKEKGANVSELVKNFLFTDMDDKMIIRSHSYMNIAIGS
jgi:hypothetical protein